MEKISSILPGNARIKAVDLKGGHPIRPGSPSFGQTEGKNSIKDKISISQAAQELLENSDTKVSAENIPSEIEKAKPLYTNQRDTKDRVSAKMVDNLAKRFFETKLEKIQEDVNPKASKEEEQLSI